MTFTPEQVEALDALEEVFGPADEKFLKNVTDGQGLGEYGYLHWIERNMKDTLIYWMQYKYAKTVDWSEKAQREREERAKALEERSAGIRDSVMTGALTALLPRAAKRFPGAEISLELNGDGACLLVDNGADEIQVSYYRTSKELYTIVEGKDYTDDVTVVNGSAPPREQFEGYAAVQDYLNDQKGN